MVRKAVLFKNAILHFRIYFLTSDWDVNFFKVFFSSPKENLTTVLKWTRYLNSSRLLLQQIPVRIQNHIAGSLTGDGDEDDDDDWEEWVNEWMKRKRIQLVVQEQFCFYAIFEKEVTGFIRKRFALSYLDCTKTWWVCWLEVMKQGERNPLTCL